jgi:hypothetical protein
MYKESAQQQREKDSTEMVGKNQKVSPYTLCIQKSIANFLALE